MGILDAWRIGLIRQEMTVFNVDFPSETTEVKFRTLQWICTEVLLALAALLNFMPRTYPILYP